MEGIRQQNLMHKTYDNKKSLVTQFMVFKRGKGVITCLLEVVYVRMV